MANRANEKGKKNISCQVSQELFDSVNDAAHELKMSKSEFMRSAIISKLRFMKNNEKRI